jgi:CRISPR type IV-associated protein Csf1
MIWNAAGRPVVEGVQNVSAACYLCGSVATGMLSKAKVLTPTFTGHSDAKALSSSWVCVPCSWSLNDASAVVGRDSGKWRNFSHAVAEGKWLTFTKKVEERRRLSALLCAPPSGPWCAVVAESGQKQLAYRAPVNHSAHRCSVQFEEQRVVYQPAAMRSLLGRMERMLTVFSKTEVASGDWDTRRIGLYGCERFAADAEEMRQLRGSALFSLAMFLAARPDDEGKDENDGTNGPESESGEPDRGHLVDGGPRIVGEAAPGDLAHLPGEHRGERVDYAGPSEVHQLSLFGDAIDSGQPGSVGGGDRGVRGGRVGGKTAGPDAG